MHTPINNSREFHAMQLADSFFPSGMYGMSWGMESFAKSGRVKDREDVKKFIIQHLTFQIGPCDSVALVAAIDAAKKRDIQGIAQVDRWYLSMKLVKEVRIASVRSGRQLLKCIAFIHPHQKLIKNFLTLVSKGKSPGSYPVCLALACTGMGIPKNSALTVMGYAYCTGIVGAAIRLGIIEHFEGQKILAELPEQLANLASLTGRKRGTADKRRSHERDGCNEKASLENMWQLSPLTDILQMSHEQDESRMFIT